MEADTTTRTKSSFMRNWAPPGARSVLPRVVLCQGSRYHVTEKSEAMSLDPGSKLGSYEILSLVGVGGMGVYRARDTKLN